mgnify:CR=1 FL=1
MRRHVSLLCDKRGVTAVEFGLIAPVFVMGLLGCFDLAHNMYTESMLQGAIQKTARDSTIEGASSSEAALDARVASAVRAVTPNATMQFDRRAYSSFSDVAKPEDFTDVDNDGVCNNGEPYEDANRNGAWDADRGSEGFGGARDAVLYTVTVTFQRAFPVAGMLGQSENMTVKTSTVLRNQPYGLQQNGAPPVENCT